MANEPAFTCAPAPEEEQELYAEAAALASAVIATDLAVAWTPRFEDDLLLLLLLLRFILRGLFVLPASAVVERNCVVMT